MSSSISRRPPDRGPTPAGVFPRARLFGLICAVALLAGCSTANAVGTKRTDSTRATISSDANTGAAANNANFAAAKLRNVDPCGVLDQNTIAQFGKSQQPHGSEDQLDSCDADLDDGHGKDLNLRVTIGGDLSDNTPSGTIAGLPAAEHLTTSVCFERLITQRHPSTGIEVEVDYNNTADSCLIARQLAGLVVNRIRTNPPPRPDGARSLAAVDPCATVDDATAANLTQGQPDRSILGFYKCDWQSAGYDLSVEFRIDTNPKNDTFDGTPKPVDVGVPAYEFASNDVYPSCDVKWEVAPVTDNTEQNDAGEIVDVQFGNVLNGSVDACAQAEAAAKIVATKVPHS